MTTDFLSKWKINADRFGPFCLGIDPSAATLQKWNLTDDVDGVNQFCNLILEWTMDRVAIVKPQIAFFERFGSKGIETLENVVSNFRARGTLVLIDAKRGDIGTTVSAYASSYFEAKSPLLCDALTANAYLGFGALEPLIEKAHDIGSSVFIVVASSNPEGMILQNSVQPNGLSVAQQLAHDINIWNEQNNSNAAGAVIGATNGENATELFEICGKAPILLPGFGAQGATFSVMSDFPGKHRLIPTASRSVLFEGSSKNDFLAALDQHIELASIAISNKK